MTIPIGVTTIDNFLPMVVSELPGFDSALTLQNLRIAVREFCKDTEMWTKQLDPINEVKDQAGYTLDPDEEDSVSILRIIEVELEDGIIDPHYYRMDNEITLVFEEGSIPDKDKDDAIEVKVVLRPMYNAVNIPTWMFERWGNTIMAFAKYKLMLMPRKPWSNPEMAIYYKKEYDQGLFEARYEKTKQFTGRDVTLNINAFSTGR